MMKNYNYPLVILIMFLTVFSVQSQSNSQKPLEVINFKKNVEAPLTANEIQMLKEVYSHNLQAEILSRPQRLMFIKDILRNRVEYFQLNGKDLSKIKPLSQIKLFNTFNNDLVRDRVFNKETFNPLKYLFRFYGRQGELVHVDYTNWIIKIKPQHHN